MRLLGALREIYAGRRMQLCVLAGAALFLALPGGWRPTVRGLVAWDAAVIAFLMATALAAADSSPGRMRRRARYQDERRWVILVVTVAAAAASLLAIGFILQKGAGEDSVGLVLRVALAGATVICAWTLTHTMFALHYAHLYYGDPDPAANPAAEDAEPRSADSGRTGPGSADRGGLDFPGAEPPDYWDFLYFSFVIGMTCQVSDVQVTSRPMRRLSLIHGVLCFFFNTVILALTVNILAGAL